MAGGKTIGEMMEEMRLKAGAKEYHGHSYGAWAFAWLVPAIPHCADYNVCPLCRYFRYCVWAYGRNLPDDQPCADPIFDIRQQRTEPGGAKLSAFPVCFRFPGLFNHDLRWHICSFDSVCCVL